MIHRARRFARRERVLGRDASVVAADWSRHLRILFGPDDVAGGKDVRHAGAEELVHPHLPVRSELDTGPLDPDAVRIGPPTRGDEQPVCSQRLAAGGMNDLGDD